MQVYTIFCDLLVEKFFCRYLILINEYYVFDRVYRRSFMLFSSYPICVKVEHFIDRNREIWQPKITIFYKFYNKYDMMCGITGITTITGI